jgi:hypothetical protein
MLGRGTAQRGRHQGGQRRGGWLLLKQLMMLLVLLLMIMMLFLYGRIQIPNFQLSQFHTQPACAAPLMMP